MGRDKYISRGVGVRLVLELIANILELGDDLDGVLWVRIPLCKRGSAVSSTATVSKCRWQYVGVVAVWVTGIGETTPRGCKSCLCSAADEWTERIGRRRAVGRDRSIAVWGCKPY